MSAVVVKVKNLDFLRCCSGNFFNSQTDWSIKSLDVVLPLKREINVAGFLLSNNSFPSFISKKLTFKSKRIEIDEEVYYSSSASWGGKMFLFKSKTVLYITEVIEKTESIKKSQSFLSETLAFRFLWLLITL